MSACPVCCLPAISFGRTTVPLHCPDCGWLLHDDYRIGSLDPDAVQLFDQRLAGARAAHDQRVVALAAGYPDAGDGRLLAQLLPAVRGAGKIPPAPEEAVQTVEHLRGGLRRSTAKVVAQIVQEIDRVRASVGLDGPTPSFNATVTVAELDRRGLGAVRFEVAEHGTVRRTGAVRQVAWNELVPTLPDDQSARLLCLAGGVAEVEQRIAVEDSLTDLAVGRGDLPMEVVGAGRVVLLVRVPRWWAVPALVDGFRARFTADRLTVITQLAPDHPSLDETLADAVLAELELNCGYGLLVADVNEKQVVTPQVTKLFQVAAKAAGPVPQQPTGVRIRAAATRGSPTLLVVLAMDGKDPRRVPVMIVELELEAGQLYDLHATLRRPGLVDFRLVPVGAVREAVSRVRRATVPEFHQAYRSMPKRYTPVTEALDIAFVVECAGDDEAVTRRLELVRAAAVLIEGTVVGPGQLRMSMIGYRDHDGSRGSVLAGCKLVDPPAFGEVLRATRPVAQMNRHASALEDGLDAGARLGWREGPVRRVLIVIGGRLACRPEDNADVPVCPRKFRLQDSRTQLRLRQVMVLALWDQPPWASPGSRDRLAGTVRKEWQSFGTGPTRPFEQTGPELLITAAGITREMPGPSLRFPIRVPS